MRVAAWTTAACLAAAVCACGCHDATADAARAVNRGDLPLAPDSEMVPGHVPPHATFAGMLRQAGVDESEVTGIVEAAQRAFDLRKLHEGQAWRFERTTSGHVRLLEYEVDPERSLRVVPDPRTPTSFDAQLVAYDTRTERVVVTGGIDQQTPSLFGAMDALGETPELPIALADIFGGEIDFNSELQPGDRFELVVEKTYRDHRFVKYGPIAAAVFSNDGRTLVGVRYQVPGAQPGYYDQAGRSLKRFFLRSPLKFDPQVTSGFSRARMHPLLHEVRAHLGVDYRAPVGAPVIAVANGVVTRAGWSGGGGNMVALRHADGYESFYLHLSSIAVRVGAHVAQGTMIGRVGQTGLATGPHLDYRLRKHGVFVNPILEHRRMPPGEPVPPALLSAYFGVRDAALSGLSVGQPAPVVAAALSRQARP